jgi:uncharacterized membrane protein YidH (DUF202 family)
MKHSERVTSVVGAVTALSTLVCCLPLGVAAAAGTASLSVVLEPLRPWLVGISVILLAIGLAQLYRSNRSCRRRSPVSLAVFLLSAIVVVGVVLFPQIIASVLANAIP